MWVGEKEAGDPGWIGIRCAAIPSSESGKHKRVPVLSLMRSCIAGTFAAAFLWWFLNPDPGMAHVSSTFSPRGAPASVSPNSCPSHDTFPRLPSADLRLGPQESQGHSGRSSRTRGPRRRGEKRGLVLLSHSPLPWRLS